VSRGPFVVRPATVDDAEQIARVHTASWQVGYRGLLPQAYLDGLDVVARTEMWARIIGGAGAKPGAVAIAETAEESVGFTSYGESRDEAADGIGEVYAVYVLPDWWRAGVGGALMSSVLVGLDAAHRAVTLWVLEGNDRGRDFYTRHGFTPDGWRKRETIGGAEVIELRLVRPAGPWP
jgi:GNAT superfamily N-acetyltransferase